MSAVIIKMGSRKHIKEALVEAMGGKCSVCGYNNTLEALCFHHVDPKQKTFNFGSYHVLNFTKFKEEMLKCVLLCCRCHSEIHSGYIPQEKVLEIYKPEIYKNIVLQERKIVRNCPIINCRICDTEFQTTSNGQKYCSNKCSSISSRKFEISKEKLEGLVNTKPLIKIGNMFGVSEAAIRKKCEVYGILYKKRDLNKTQT